jgi:hypothetical protein
MLQVTALSSAIKVGNVSVKEMDQITLEALAYAQSVGTKATSAASERQVWAMTAIAAIGIQNALGVSKVIGKRADGSELEELQFPDTKAALIELQKHKDAVKSALRGTVLLDAVRQLRLARDVKAASTKQADGTRAELDSPQTLVMRAVKKLDNYYDARIGKAWTLGLMVQYDTDTDGNILPEAAGKLYKRVQTREVMDAPATGASAINGELGRFQSNISAMLKDDTSIEQAEGIKTLLDSAYAVILRHLHGVVSTQEIQDAASILFDVGAEADPELADIPEELSNADETNALKAELGEETPDASAVA